MPENSSLAGLPMEGSLLYWNDSGVWNPVDRRIQWVGGPGTCCTDSPIYQLITYDVATDTWTIEATPYSGSGHAYDGNALDPGTGDHYFARYFDNTVHRFAGGRWSDLPNIPFDAVPTMGLSWFPELGDAGGLVYVGTTGRVAWFDGAAWARVREAESAPWGTYNTFSEYNPVLQLMWMGAGNGGSRVHYAMSSDLRMRRLADAPFSLNNSQALHSVDPIGGDFIVTNLDNGTYWALDVQRDTWTQITDMAGTPSFSESVFQVPIADCGVILYFDHYHEYRTVWIYRHSSV
jgi:hypothetical protein